MARQYKLNQRAKSQAETRQKIVEAAIELHQEKGPAATSMRDVAERAGVGTVTVYRHFSDDMELLGACSGAYFERHPFPDLEGWRHILDPVERFRWGLREAYAFHKDVEPMMASVIDDVRHLPIMDPYYVYWQSAVDVLPDAFTEEAQSNAQLKAGIALSLRFETWELLTKEHGLSIEEATDLMERLLRVREAKSSGRGP
jgi:AcrR family transcriptional regulator